MSKWIKVKDRLPTTDTVFFVFGRKVTGQNKRYIYTAWYNQTPEFCVWYETGSFGILHDVTHWRHMIMPPAVEEACDGESR